MSRAVPLCRTVLKQCYARRNGAAVDKLSPTTTASSITDEDKFGVYESSADSGFISGGNLVFSGDDIRSSESWNISGPAAAAVPPQEKSTAKANKEQQQEYMRLDSGVDLLSESLSGLSFVSSTAGQDLNDLSRASSKSKPRENKNVNLLSRQPPVVVESQQQQILSNPANTGTEQDLPWMQYFQQDEDGDTLLHIAILKGFVEMVLALIRLAPHPFLLDTPNDESCTPLHLAVLTGQPKVVRWLIVAGAKPSPRNMHGDSPCHIAARNGDLDSCKALTNPIQEQERTALALLYPQQPYQQADLNQWNFEGQTCVHMAALYGHVDILRHLVWYGADINAREGRGGYTALHIAIERNDERMAYFLLTECSKLDIDTETYGGRGPLQLGCEVPTRIVEILRSRGAATSYDSSSDEDYEFSDGDDNYENIYVPNLVNASA